ncbi:hypothetical protein PMAYCL1PPCAC_06259, partial [Pristionchus mayeri]
RSVHSSLPYTHYFLLAGSYSNEIVEASKFLMMLSIGYRIHRFILCAIFTKQASRMHRMGLRVISYQPSAVVPNYTASALDASDGLRISVLPKITEPSLFTRYCSKV